MVNCLFRQLGILVVVAALAGACGGKPPGIVETSTAYSKQVHKRLRRTIDDKARRKELRALQDRVDRAEARAALAGITAAEKIRANPDITPEQTAEIAASCMDARKEAFWEIGTVRMEMRKQMSKEEWTEVFGETD